jgi:DNA-binding PadR family transcriptional regulator
MIALCDETTGYEIKQIVDHSTRFFWAASYGQIYPELRRLEDRGLVRGTSQPSGGRARRVYTLTPSGRRALEGWLSSPEEHFYELRDEGMLKLFFSDSLPAQRIANLAQLRSQQERKLAQLEEIAAAKDTMQLGPRLTLSLGSGLTQWLINWCRETESLLAAETEKE